MARTYPESVKGWGEAQRKYDVFARLNNLRDWNGYSKKQEECRTWLRDWLERSCDLSDSQYKEALPVAYCHLPHYDGDAYSETCHIFEREVWWNLDDLGPDMQSYKSANRDWLEDRRKQVYHNAVGDSEANPDSKPYGWDKQNRRQRYDYLQVATKYGSAWEEWRKTHDTETGEPKAPPEPPKADTRHRLSDHFIVEEFDCHNGAKVASREYDGLESLCRTFLEPLRSKYGSVHINSGFRTHDYNASVGGASGSYHVYNEHDGDDQAADITCASGSPSQWHSYLSQIRANERSGKGGLGLYSTFVHVDLRDYQSNWTG